MTDRKDLAEVIRKRIEKLNKNDEKPKTALQKAYEEAEPSQEPSEDPEKASKSNEGKESDKQSKKALKAKQKRLKGYVNGGGKQRGK